MPTGAVAQRDQRDITCIRAQNSAVLRRLPDGAWNTWSGGARIGFEPPGRLRASHGIDIACTRFDLLAPTSRWLDPAELLYTVAGQDTSMGVGGALIMCSLR